MKNTENARKGEKEKANEFLRKRERTLSILPESQNLYMVNTPFEDKKLM